MSEEIRTDKSNYFSYLHLPTVEHTLFIDGKKNYRRMVVPAIPLHRFNLQGIVDHAITQVKGNPKVDHFDSVVLFRHENLLSDEQINSLKKAGLKIAFIESPEVSRTVGLKKAGQMAGSAGTLAGLNGLLRTYVDNKPFSRRDFLKIGSYGLLLLAGMHTASFGFKKGVVSTPGLQDDSLSEVNNALLFHAFKHELPSKGCLRPLVLSKSDLSFVPSGSEIRLAASLEPKIKLLGDD